MNFKKPPLRATCLLQYRRGQSFHFVLALLMSLTARDEARQFLAALGERLGSHAHDADSSDRTKEIRGQELALRLLWQIAPLSSGRRGAPTEFRGYTAQHGDAIFAIVELLIECLASVYRHDAIIPFLAEHEELRARSRRNLRAIVHPQNMLRPFDPLDTIGRAFRPLFLLRPHIDPQVTRDALRKDFELVGLEETVGGWGKAWFVGLLVSTYLCWRWHGEIAVSTKYPGWYSTRPLWQLEDNESENQVALNRVLPTDPTGPHLVSENSAALSFPDLGDDWTRMHAWESDAYAKPAGGDVAGNMAPKFKSGPIPHRPQPPRFESYSDWLVAALGLYSGAGDRRLDGEDLASCLMKSGQTNAPDSNLHMFSSIATSVAKDIFGHSGPLLEVLPQAPDFLERESPQWGIMMTTLLTEYRRDYRRGKSNGSLCDEGRDLGDWKVARYPIETYSNRDGMPTVGRLAGVLAYAMPNFRNLTSRTWMFYLDEPASGRFSHPEDRAKSTSAVRSHP